MVDMRSPAFSWVWGFDDGGSRVGLGTATVISVVNGSDLRNYTEGSSGSQTEIDGPGVPSATVPASARPMRADAVRNRQRIIGSAAAALAESGPDVALEEIAGRAGVGIGTLYRHFPDRHSLLVAVYREGFDALAALGVELADADDPADAFRQFLEANLDFSRTNRALAAGVIMAALDQMALPQAVESPCQVICERGTALLERAQEAGAVRADIDVDHVMRLVAAIAMATDGCSGSQVSSSHLLTLVFDGLTAGCAEVDRSD